MHESLGNIILRVFEQSYIEHVGDMVIPCLRQCSETEYTKWVKKLVYQGLRSALHQQTVPLENETSFAKQSKI